MTIRRRPIAIRLKTARINRNEIIVRFAEILPDDLYRIELFAQDNVVPGGTALRDRGGDALSPLNPNADREIMDFELSLGPQVVSVVPQPVTWNVQHVRTPTPRTGALVTLTFIDQAIAVADNLTPSQLQTALETGLANVQPGDVVVSGLAGDWQIAFHGRYNEQNIPLIQASNPAVLVEWVLRPNTVRATHQARDQVLVYFNGDPLAPTAATDPKFYRLIDTAGTLTDADDRVLLPTRVSYDPRVNLATLLFAGDLPDATYRLDIGGSQEVDNRLSTAASVGTLFDHNPAGPEFDFAGYTGDDTTGSSGNANDVDLFQFRLAVGATVTVTVQPRGTHNTVIRLFDELGNDVGVPADTGSAGQTDTLTEAGLPAGIYYVGVSSSGNSLYDPILGTGASGGSTTGSYVLALNVDGTLTIDDNNSSFATATNLGVLAAAGQTFRSQIEPQTHVLMPPNPGGIDEPSHRQIQAEAHIGAAGVTPSPGGGIGVGGLLLPRRLRRVAAGQRQPAAQPDYRRRKAADAGDLRGILGQDGPGRPGGRRHAGDQGRRADRQPDVDARRRRIDQLHHHGWRLLLEQQRMGRRFLGRAVPRDRPHAGAGALLRHSDDHGRRDAELGVPRPIGTWCT